MFDSIKNWLNRTDRHQADRQKLEAEAKDFRLPSETLPQVFAAEVSMTGTDGRDLRTGEEVCQEKAQQPKS